jgi:type I restriction enzyme S subunit
MGADGVKVLRPKIEADLRYLYYYLQTIKLPEAGYDRHFKYLKRIEVVVPPLLEQRRIAAILDQADALRVKRREALAQLDSLTQSIFIEMFGDPVTNPKGWSCKPLGSVVKTTSGGTPDRSAYGYYDGDIPWVKSGELHHRLVTETEERITELGLKNSSAKLMPPGTVLVAMYGATVGAVSELGIHAATNQAICCMQPSEILLPCYLIAFMKQYTPTLLMRRVGGAQPNLSQDLLRNIQLPLAPINIQNQFKERLESTDYLVACHQRSKQQLDSLFASLQHRAFRGEI